MRDVLYEHDHEKYPPFAPKLFGLLGGNPIISTGIFHRESGPVGYIIKDYGWIKIWIIDD